MKNGKTIKLNDYKLEPEVNYYDPKSTHILSFHYTYKDNKYLVDTELDFDNVIIFTVYELNNIVKKYVSDCGENLYLVFNKLEITELELEEYVAGHMQKYECAIFENQAIL